LIEGRLKTVIISDCHFGYDNFNAPEFERFLTYLEDSRDANRIVLLGDVLDLWRSDPVDALVLSSPYLERIRRLNVKVDYVVGNHDYHSWVSQEAKGMTEKFLWMNIHYPYLIIEDMFLTHGDYFDIYKYDFLREAVYTIYEAIYHLDEPTVSVLERYFYDPYKLVMEWLRRIKGKERVFTLASERAPFIPQEVGESLEMILEKKDKKTLEKLERGLEYLYQNQDLAVHLFVPTYERKRLLSRELPRAMQAKPRRKALLTLAKIDRSQYTRTLIFEEGILERARKISQNPKIAKVVYGHTHKAEMKREEGYCNTGSWVEGESTFAEVVDGEVSVYRMKDGVKTEL